MIKIRRSVFETNSSSSHSISILRKNVEPEDYWDVFSIDGELYLRTYLLEFGRTPFKVLYKFIDKCRYAIAYYNSFEEDKVDEICNLIKKKLPQVKTIIFSKKDEYDYSKNDFTGEVVNDYGEIDHQSCGVLDRFLKANNLTLEEFLCNPKYVVFVDGDEYNVKENLFLSGLLHEEDFVNWSNTKDLEYI